MNKQAQKEANLCISGENEQLLNESDVTRIQSHEFIIARAPRVKQVIDQQR